MAYAYQDRGDGVFECARSTFAGRKADRKAAGARRFVFDVLCPLELTEPLASFDSRAAAQAFAFDPMSNEVGDSAAFRELSRRILTSRRAFNFQIQRRAI